MTANRGFDHFQADLTGRQRSFKMLAVTIDGRQFHIDPGAQAKSGSFLTGGGGAMVSVNHRDGFVVRNDQAVETEFFAEQFGQNPARGGHQFAIQLRISVHDSVQPGANRGLEGQHINVPQVAQAQAHRGAVLATLREAVTDKMLGGRHHAAIFEAFTLQTLNVSHPKVADEQRVFAESLFHPPPAGIAGHIQDRGQALVGADRPQLTSDLGGHPLGQLGPPGGGQAEHLRVNRAAQSHISGAALLVDDGWDAQAGFFDQISLESIVETGNGGRFKGGITRRTSNLADAVGQELPGLSSRKIRARLNLVRPSRIQLGQFFIQGHLGEKSFNAGSDGEGSVTVRH